MTSDAENRRTLTGYNAKVLCKAFNKKKNNTLIIGLVTYDTARILEISENTNYTILNFGIDTVKVYKYGEQNFYLHHLCNLDEYREYTINRNVKFRTMK